MNVEQKEVNVFLVTLDEAEFEQVQDKAVELGITVELVMLDISTCGFAGYFVN